MDDSRFIYPLRAMSLTGLMKNIEERLAMAIDNKLAVDENENGYIYETATKEDVRYEVKQIVKQIQYEMINLNASARALEAIAGKYREQLGIEYPDMMQAYIMESEKVKSEMYEALGDLDDGGDLSATERAKRAGFYIVKPSENNEESEEKTMVQGLKAIAELSESLMQDRDSLIVVYYDFEKQEYLGEKCHAEPLEESVKEPLYLAFTLHKKVTEDEIRRYVEEEVILPAYKPE